MGSGQERMYDDFEQEQAQLKNEHLEQVMEKFKKHPSKFDEVVDCLSELRKDIRLSHDEAYYFEKILDIFEIK